MSEVSTWSTSINLGEEAASALSDLGTACAAAGVGLAQAVAQVCSGARSGFSQAMEKAVARLATPEQRGVEEASIDGLRSLDTLRRACVQIATDRGGERVDAVRDAGGREEHVLVGVSFPGAEAGIGVRVGANGELAVAADSSLVPRELIEEFREELETTYTAIGVREAFEALRYDYSIERPSRRECVLMGVRVG